MAESALRVNELFQSIQGEGVHMGLPTVFIRTAGCNLTCSWCDTPYARALEAGRNMRISEIINEVKKYSAEYVCITGGEPLLQKPVRKLVRLLLSMNYNVDLETNGSVSLKKLPRNKRVFISMDIKCPSSRMENEMDFSNIALLRSADQLKLVIADAADYEYAKDIIQRYKPKCNIVFQPVYGTDPKILAEHALKDGLKVRVLVQLHKILWGEKKGV